MIYSHCPPLTVASPQLICNFVKMTSVLQPPLESSLPAHHWSSGHHYWQHATGLEGKLLPPVALHMLFPCFVWTWYDLLLVQTQQDIFMFHLWDLWGTAQSVSWDLRLWAQEISFLVTQDNGIWNEENNRWSKGSKEKRSSFMRVISLLKPVTDLEIL